MHNLNFTHALNYKSKMSETTPALDNPYFESHLEMTELDRDVAVGVDAT